jgi:hypothetical protein
VKIAVLLEPASGTPGEVLYRWDRDTDILSAQLPPQPGVSDGMSGSVGLEGSDGSWLILDVNEGRINGVEVAVWPDVRELARLALPSKIEEASVTVPGRKSQPDIASVGMAARNIVAEADQGGKNFHFRMGKLRETRTIRLGKDLLLDLDEKSQISGLWLLNVPPCPSDS